MSHLFQKNSKLSAFFDENWPENFFWEKVLQPAAELNGVPSINSKILAFQSLL